MSKVTYLLGAGASYGSRLEGDGAGYELSSTILRGLPILSDFPEVVYQMQREVFYNSNIEEEKKKQIREILDNISNVSNEYPTIDTYSKMLYTIKQFEEYEKFKEQIALFFLLWQRLHKHDIRYDSFIASLIDAETGDFPPLTILTWNYDMQFEMSYSKYTKDQTLWKIWNKLNVCCKSSDTLPKYNPTLPFAFIKLNGSATFHASEKDETDPLREALEKAGAVVLNESYTDTSLYGIGVRIGGMYNNAYELTNLRNEVKRRYAGTWNFLNDYQNTENLKIMLSIRPESFLYSDACKNWDLDLVVSGNDLGGLVVVPHYGGVFGGSMGYFPEFVHGMSEKEDVKLFITSGLSAPKNLIPRLNNPPEIAVVDIDGLSREQM